MTDGKSDTSWGSEMDAPEHEKSFENFVTFTKYSSIGLAVMLILMAIFLL